MHEAQPPRVDSPSGNIESVCMTGESANK
ncbi:hypothetical protein CBM2589_B220047 [Cupriavidus taiwanensis]|uniref:Uncharacterized protein n=1 Tax=Cupriavidus taiwanensis TaxID=164546 RepID=A0A975WYM1_9BURK|nr:hypothetical protein CBM2589_B220047 [Cupriavidus taiwanensis]